MAKGVNKVFLLGNVGKDPEIRSTAGGLTVASFSLATADRQSAALLGAMVSGAFDDVYGLKRRRS